MVAPEHKLRRIENLFDVSDSNPPSNFNEVRQIQIITNRSLTRREQANVLHALRVKYHQLLPQVAKSPIQSWEASLKEFVNNRPNYGTRIRGITMARSGLREFCIENPLRVR